MGRARRARPRPSGLLLAIKQAVDQDRRPGRFLLTGSANLMLVPGVADSLAGRMETLNLLPLAGCEIHGGKGRWLDTVFAGHPPRGAAAAAQLGTGGVLTRAVLAGGYPEAVARADARRRTAWARQYIDALVQRDVREIASVEKLDHLARLPRVLAAMSGQLCNFTEMGGQVGLDSKTAAKYLAIFEGPGGSGLRGREPRRRRGWRGSEGRRQCEPRRLRRPAQIGDPGWTKVRRRCRTLRRRRDAAGRRPPVGGADFHALAELTREPARLHQFLGVNNAIASMLAARTLGHGRGGVFWQTQGSGKSFSMVFFAQKVLRRLVGNWTFVVVTDRVELGPRAARTSESCCAGTTATCSP